MQIIACTQFTVNGGRDQEKDIPLVMPDDFDPAQDTSYYQVAAKAAEALVAEGSIMISSVGIMRPDQVTA